MIVAPNDDNGSVEWPPRWMGTIVAPDDPSASPPIPHDSDPVARAEARRFRAGNVFDLVNATTEATRALDELAIAIDGEDDWRDGISRFDRGVADLRRKHSEIFRDAADRAMFDDHLDRFAALRRMDLRQGLADSQHAAAFGKLDETLAYYAGRAAQAKYPIERDMFSDAGMEAIERLRAAGYMGPQLANLFQGDFWKQIEEFGQPKPAPAIVANETALPELLLAAGRGEEPPEFLRNIIRQLVLRYGWELRRKQTDRSVPQPESKEAPTQKPKSDDEITAARKEWADKGIPIGDFGPVFEELRGNWKEGLQRLIEAQDGEVPAALHHPEIGDIDLIWGKTGTGASDGYGIAKIAKFHPEVLDDLQNVIADMHVISRSDNRVRLESSTHNATVRLEYDDRKKTWLLTAYGKEESALRSADDGQAEPHGRTDTAPPSQGMKNLGATPRQNNGGKAKPEKKP